MKEATIRRKTAETEIELTLSVRGEGTARIDTGCGFLDHMLTLFARHGAFDLTVKCEGDTYVDYHHTVEDVGIALGQAFHEALGNKEGIARYGFFVLPMDEALLLSSVDFSGRSGLFYDVAIPAVKVGDFDTELAEEFWQGFVRNANCTLHVKKLAGSNSHHIIEGTFKSVARSIRAAVAEDPAMRGKVPSTKGTL